MFRTVAKNTLIDFGREVTILINALEKVEGVVFVCGVIVLIVVTP
jgi:hypothetical protein